MTTTPTSAELAPVDERHSLIEALQKCKGSDPELDRRLCLLFGFTKSGDIWHDVVEEAARLFAEFPELTDWPALTSDRNAVHDLSDALGMPAIWRKEEIAPVAGQSKGDWDAYLVTPDSHYLGTAPTEPAAMLICLVKAKGGQS